VLLAGDLAYVQPERSEMKPLADAIVAGAGPDARVIDVCPEDPRRSAPPDLSIYLNRIVRPLASVGETSNESAGDTVVVVVGSGAAAGPQPPAAGGWHQLGAGGGRRGATKWQAFVQAPPAAPTPASPRLTSADARE
jgi:hypothetical protein